MIKGILKKVVGDPNEREIRKLRPLVEAINALEPEMERRTDAELRALTDRFRARLASGESLDDLLVEAFAAVREVAKRTVDMRPFDVQLIGGIVLHRGMVAEMKTGEGKTLVATMPLYLNALLGRGVHLVTVNDYLARRDALWMGKVYHALGLSVGLLQSGREQPAYLYDPDYRRDPYPGLRPVPRKEAYAADITYGTNNEFGFDYLRDNLALRLEDRVQRDLYYAIVDEVDNIFIDEARTPLIISGPSDEPVEDYKRFAAIARKLEPGVHYELDEKERSVYLTDEGLALVEQETGIENIYDEANYRYVHYMQQALKAQVLFLEGRDYIRQRKQIILIDQHTGRLMPNRRLSEGLHQAIEAKEGVPIRPRDVTSATITIQNYFRMYEKLAGMSGTAVTEAEEFYKIYNLEVLAIPTNKPVIRIDHPDVVYRNQEAKLRAVAREILECHSRGQPVLVGTTSVEMSERLSKRLDAERLQMAALTPRIAYALQDADLDRDRRDALRATMNGNLETMNLAAWKRMMRTLGLDPNMLSADNLRWIADYLQLEDEAARRTLEQALRNGIAHSVLNAKEHTREAAIIARAGEPGAVTIATNMAGRGVDIKLGGELSDETIHKAHQVLRARGINPFQATPAQMDSAIAEVDPQYAKRREQVLAAGGLHVLGTERHEARRIDNQLRGRAGRQGEPGSSRFYISLEDDLMRRFGRKEMLARLMESIGDDFPIEHKLVSKTIEKAQASVEGYNFDIRKHLLEYDDVLNLQRETIYGERLRILQSDDLRPEVWRMLEWQVDEYLDKIGEDPDRRRVLFAGLDDVVPLILPSPNDPFQGPLRFGSHLTAFPPFTIGFLADRFAGQPLEQVQTALADLSRRAAADYGRQVRRTVAEVAQATEEKYDEWLERYRLLLDEKIDDYLQLLEERGQPLDPRRLAQHLERTYPLKLSFPSAQEQTEIGDLDDLRDYWQEEVAIRFHRQTCAGLLDRVQVRLPGDIRLDRLRPAMLPAPKLAEEMGRVRDLARKQPRDEAARAFLDRLEPPAGADAAQVADFVAAVKEHSTLDYGRLDRLVGHILGAYLDDLIGRYLAALGDEGGRPARDLERLRASIVEGKRGRGNNLPAILRELNNRVHLEIPTLADLLDLAVAHEYDKWAQRQLNEIEADAARNALTDTDWASIAEWLLAAHFTQRQVYDRGHRRRTTWSPRLPFNFLAQAHVQEMETDELRDAILDSLRWAVEQREQVWGQQEFQRWGTLSLADLDTETYDDLLRFLGGEALGDLRRQPVEDLPADLYNRLQFILALHRWEEQDLRLGDLPQAEALLNRLADAWQERLLATPVGELDGELQERVDDFLRRAGTVDDETAKQSLLAQPISAWDRRTRDRVAAFWGERYIRAHQEQPIAELEDGVRETVIAFLQSRRRFVDEERIQHFLVHERLGDLPPETARAALLHLARRRLDRLSRRKIANLDVNTRRIVVESLQRQGLFSDETRRAALLARPLTELDEEVRAGFARFLAERQLAGRPLAELAEETQRRVLDRLKEMGALADPEQAERLGGLRLAELEAAVQGDLVGAVRREVLARQRADLAAKTMEELPEETRQLVHRVLEDLNYFVDEDKVAWYERKTLAQLPGDLLDGLEMHLGRVQLDSLADTPFRELDGELQRSLLAFFDAEGLLTDRAARLRLTQTGSLGQLDDKAQRAVARHLGRQWSVRLRNKRPPDLPAADREAVWVFLRAQGYFADEFKEELFAYQRLDEFGDEARQAVEAALAARLDHLLATTPIADLPADLRAVVEDVLKQGDYLVDPARRRQVLETPPAHLPPDLGEALLRALGRCLLADLGAKPVADLPAEVQAALTRYLDEIGYFVDEQKRSRVLDRRLADLPAEQYEALVRDLAEHLAAEIGETPVSDLDEGLRQGLRASLEEMGYFESDAVRAELLNRPLGRLRREDLDALAVEIGALRLAELGDQRLADLPAPEREAVMAHLQAAGWFQDRLRLEKVRARPLADLPADLRRELIGTLRDRYIEDLRRQRLARLDRAQRRRVHRILRELGVTGDEEPLRALRRKPVEELEPEVYRRLLRDLGEQVVADWGDTPFQEMDEERRALLVAYLGRRIMGRIERRVLLHTISRLWIDYLTDIEDLRRGIGLEAFGQRDPLVEYKRRAFELFEELGQNIRRTVVRSLFRQPPEPLRKE